MPYEWGVDKNGPFVRWGQHGKKYHYKAGNKRSKAAAFAKASKQRAAILATGWREKGDAKAETTLTAKERIKRTILKMRAAGVRFIRKRKTAPINYPRRLEEDYTRQIDRIVKAAVETAFQRLKALLPEIKAAYDAEHRHDTKGGDLLAEAMKAAKIAIETNFRAPLIEQAALLMAEKIGAFNYREVERHFSSRLGVNPLETEPYLATMIDEWVERNVSLITSIAPEYLRQVEQIVWRGIEQGRSTDDITSDIWERFEVTRSRARLIARDQVGKFFGDLTKQRNQQAGVSRFIWRTSGDERVRPSHAELDGEEFSWEEGAIDSQTGERIWPGTAIQCRCTAEAVFEEIEEALEAEEEEEG